MQMLSPRKVVNKVILRTNMKSFSDFFRKFVSFVEEHEGSGSTDENEKYIFTRYSKKGWNFLGPYWERRSVNVKDEHEKLITDLLLQYFVY